MAQQEVELDRNWTKSTARSDELEALIVANKDLVSATHYNTLCHACRIGAQTPPSKVSLVILKKQKSRTSYRVNEAARYCTSQVPHPTSPSRAR